jgi:hypothetical protein
MKSLLLSLTILLLTVFSASCQTIVGTYTNKWQARSGEAISYTLTLEDDGTFTFQSISSYMETIPDTTIEAKGTWRLDNHLLVLTTQGDSTELSSNLNKNKAKYLNISLRNPNLNMVKPSLRFYESRVFYAKNMELIKSETSVTTISD